MKIMEENVMDRTIEKTEEFVRMAIDRLTKFSQQVSAKIKQEYIPLMEDLMKNLTGEIKGTAFGKDVECLDMQTLVAMGKEYMVDDCNEIVATKVKDDVAFYVYLAYSKDRQMLPVSKNRYIIIKAKSLAPEVENIFAESELVILK